MTNAHRINAGQFPRLVPTTKFAQSDCLWLEAPEPALGAEGIGHLVSEYLPKHGIDPVQQVQVLSPSTRGEVGTRQLNAMLQRVLNPPASGKTELARGGSTLRVGDRGYTIRPFAIIPWRGLYGVFFSVQEYHGNAGQLPKRFTTVTSR